MLELPDFDALSIEQEDILDIPLGKSAMVIGPPGTGKTVMAIYRARALHKEGHDTSLLMYGKLLSTYTSAAVKQLDLGGAVSTYHSWFPRIWKAHYNEEPPKLDTFTFDWDKCLAKLMKNPIPRKKLHILIDEGQDMPADFYLVVNQVAASLTVFADENQRITDQQSTIDDIKASTGISDVRELTRNYRNTLPIAKFAATFYTGLRTGIPNLPPSSARGEKPALYQHDNMFAELASVVTYERNYPDHTIGVIVPKRELIKKMYNRLKDKTKNPVQVYMSQKPGETPLPKIDFGAPGVKIVTHASAKGLEFHAVFLPQINTYWGDPASDDVKMKMYVLSSRARRVLNLSYTGDGTPTHVDALPLALMKDRR
jgi:superfamily I DNA/RNA helicase